VSAAVAAVADQYGGLDVLVNKAGIGAQGTVADNDDTECYRALDVNVVGMARVSAAELPWLWKSTHAAIVNTCSDLTAQLSPSEREAIFGDTAARVYRLLPSSEVV
jgi:NAD(P)-dependent dehydrogenase (short-subunit alcohol dehydrogenase family)